MIKYLTMVVVVCSILAGSICSAAAVTSISKDEAQNWVRYTVPLPKSIEITGKISVPKGGVNLVVPNESDIVLNQACVELKTALDPSINGVYTVEMVLGGPLAEPLKSLKNSDQAYIISSTENDMKLVALSSNGLYYAAKTLQQLLRAYSTDKELVLPVVQIKDWPDMEKRGIWGVDNWAHLKWFANCKMNYMEQISACGIDDTGKPFARLSSEERRPLLDEGPYYGIEFTPVILHLEQVWSDNMKKFHPEYQGKNTPRESALCYSQPGVVDMISDWMVQLASMPHVTAIDAWMAENMRGMPGCQCDKCKLEDRSVLEVRTILAALEKAKKKLGRDITLYVLTSEETEKSNPKVFAELPAGVRIWYYHSLFTYNTSHMPMIRPYLVDAVKQGHWVGVCPNLDCITMFIQPFTGAAFVNARMNEFVDKGLSGLIGFPTPRIHYNYFNVEAAAEWSWNSKGRSTKEFALSYAVRNGYKDPEKYAEWSETVGPVAWDIHGSSWPAGEQRDCPEDAAIRLKKGTLPPFGYFLWDIYPTPWGDIKSEQQLYDDVAAAEKGIQLAKELGMRDVMYESLMVDGYARSLKALYELSKIVKDGKVAPEHSAEAEYYFKMYVDGLGTVTDVVPKWEKLVRRPSEPYEYTKQPMDFVRSMIKQMEEVAAGMGYNIKED